MNSKYFIKLIVIIIVILVYLYFKKQQNKEKKLTQKIIDKHKTRNVPAKTYQLTKVEKEQLFNCLRQLIHILINTNEAKEIINIIKTRNTKFDSKNNWSISNELVCQEVINYQFKNNIYLYGFFDWKTESTQLDDFLKKAVEAKFGIDISIEDPIDFSIDKFIHDVFPKYEQALSKYNIKLRNIHINSDSYQVILIKSEDYKKVERLINSMGLKLQIVNNQ